MTAYRRRWLLFLLLLTACAAWAAAPWVDLERRFTPAQMHETGLDTLQPVQLASLNRLLRDEAATARASVATVPSESGEQRKSFFGYDEGVILTRLVGTLTAWEPGTEFTLANGQRWKVLKGHYTLNKPRENPEVKLVPGAAGRWFFRIDDDTPGARVYRVD